MINLFEQFDAQTQILYSTLKEAGHEDKTIVLEDDGFLPDEVSSPYRFFADYRIPNRQRPIYFNEVEIPRFWEITGSNDHAQILDMSEKRANILYRPHFKSRVVSEVEWLDKAGRLRFVDHYTKQGILYAQTVYDLSGKAILKKYMDQQGKEVLYENYVTQDIVLDWQGKSYFFDSKVAFITFYIEAMGIDNEQFTINSLATSFAVLYNMDDPGHDVLYWQESCEGNTPGNMELIFEGGVPREFDVIVPEQAEYEVIKQHTDSSAHKKLHRGGYVYHYHKQNNYNKEILTMTNSDQIAYLEETVKACPDYTFHIGAVTEMSPKLLRLGQYNNVRLFPAIDLDTAAQLFKRCDIYLDINHGGEILNAVEEAYLHDMLIISYEATAHNRVKTAPELLFPLEDQPDRLIKVLYEIGHDQAQFKDYLSLQKDHANAVTRRKFNTVLNQVFKKTKTKRKPRKRSK
ncbi:accessory Sec system glycosylation chaperone GtfB [Staphylococcus auricularis]|uniref:accessory Sec system glycosylation chaperone GtfB n=1 Tax=Staphylococcus auricularis TaxID=29379 RepID=UPI003EBF9EFF